MFSNIHQYINTLNKGKTVKIYLRESKVKPKISFYLKYTTKGGKKERNWKFLKVLQVIP